MIQKAVVTRNMKYNGSIFDAFEYFYRAWELDKNVKFVSKFIHINEYFLSRKYNVDNRCFKNFIYGEPYNLIFDKILLFDTYNFGDIESDFILKTNKLYVISNSTRKFKENTEYFDEYFLFKNYINKIYFDIHKKFDHLNNVYINAMDTNNLKYVELLKKYPNALLKDSKSNYQVYTKTKNFIPDIYKYFNKYIYLKTQKTVDRHPRQFAECEYQGIECEFISIGDPHSNGCNAYKRFCDRKDLKKRDIHNDIVIERFLE